LVLLCACGGTLRAEPPQLNPTDDQIQAAAQTLALTATPGVGPLQAVSMLKLGDVASVWSIEWVMTRPHARTAVGASTLVLAGFGPNAPWTQAAVLQLGAQPDDGKWPYLSCWAPFDPNVLRPLDETLLMLVRDRTGAPSLKDGDLELKAYLAMLQLAAQTSDAAFLKAAQPLDRTTAMTRPKASRGKVFHFEGQLIHLRRYDAPSALREGCNLRNVYEAWVKNPKKFGEKTPVCVLLTELPPGLEPEEDMDVPVKFAGMYYKLLRYPVEDKEKPWKECPLLMAHTLTVQPEEAPAVEEPSWGRQMLPVLLWSLVGIVGVVAGMSWWFRAGDRAVQRRLRQARDAAVAPPELGPEPSESETPSGEPGASAPEDPGG
jgi:hypothetical protein